MIAIVATSALTVGLLAGLLTFRLKQRWCPDCGATLTCPDTTYHSATIDRRFTGEHVRDPNTTTPFKVLPEDL